MKDKVNILADWIYKQWYNDRYDDLNGDEMYASLYNQALSAGYTIKQIDKAYHLAGERLTKYSGRDLEEMKYVELDVPCPHIISPQYY